MDLASSSSYKMDKGFCWRLEGDWGGVLYVGLRCIFVRREGKMKPVLLSSIFFQVYLLFVRNVVMSLG